MSKFDNVVFHQCNKCSKRRFKYPSVTDILNWVDMDWKFELDTKNRWDVKEIWLCGDCKTKE